MDELIVFHSLNEEEIRKITELMLRQVADRLKEQEIILTWDKQVTEKLAKDGYDPKFGARPLRRLIQRTVEDTMSEELLEGHIQLGQEIRLTVKKDKIAVSVKPDKKKKADPEAAAAEPEKEENPVG